MTQRVEPRRDFLQPRSRQDRSTPAAWRLAARVDGRVAVLLAIATALTAGALYWTRFVPASNWGPFAVVAPVVSGGFFVAMIAMLAERNRHGLVRTISFVGAAILLITGGFFVSSAGVAWVVASYWAPATMALVACVMLQRAHPTAAQPPSTHGKAGS